MALVPVLGGLLDYPEIPYLSHLPSLGNILLDAANEKVGFIGHFYNKDLTSKDITKVHFRTATVTFNVASVLDISLQNVSTTGQPYRPDETPDQNATLTGTAVAANSYLATGALSANRTVAPFEMLAICFEITTFNTSDAVNITGVNSAAGSTLHSVGSVHRSAAGTWSLQNPLPNVILEATDGTFGTLLGSYPAHALTTSSNFNNTSTPDEHALRMTIPFDCEIHGMWLDMALASATGACDLILYDSGGTAQKTRSVADEEFSSTSARFGYFMFSSGYTYNAGDEIYLAIQPTNNQNVNYAYIDLASANHMQALSGSTNCYLATRTDAGAWSTTTTRRPMIGALLSKLDDGAGGGSSGSGGNRIITPVGGMQRFSY